MSSERTSFFSQPFSIQWRKALVSAPRLVPLAALKYTSAEGPQPFILNLPSRGKYLIPCYVFVPTQIEAEKDANGLPVIIDFHGGGFVLGSCLEQGPFCAKMARDLGAVVICVDYRMGPIDKFPAAIEDGEDVLSAVLDENAPGGKELRDAVEKRLTVDEKKALRKARKIAKKRIKADLKAQRRLERKDIKGVRPVLAHKLSSSLIQARRNKLNAQDLPGSLLNPGSAVRPTLSRTVTDTSITSTASLSRVGSNLSGGATSTPVSAAGSTASSATDELHLGPIPVLDSSRIALSGFSSGGNLILNLALSIPASEPFVKTPWPSRFPADYPNKIPLLLYYPSFDCRQLPSERTRPNGLEAGGGFWSEANDLLMPTYLPRDLAAHPRASPGLAELKHGTTPGLGLHDQVRMQLVLPELDSLSEQSEIWVKKVAEQGRAEHLTVERYKGMKHGWTQMPEGWLTVDERSTRLTAFENSVKIVREAWEKIVGSEADIDGPEIKDITAEGVEKPSVVVSEL